MDITSHNYREYVTNDLLAGASSLENKIRRIEMERRTLNGKNVNKWLTFALIIGAIENDVELSNIYEINEEAHFWSDRIIRKKTQRNPDTLSLTAPLECYPILPQCYDYYDQDFSGLYFIGATYFVPTTMQPIYAVKIGTSQNVGERIKSYGTQNPFIYHTREMSLPYKLCPYAKEKTCHDFLAALAIQKFDKNSEWYIVNKETYFSLCENMSNHEFFAKVATGKIRAI